MVNVLRDTYMSLLRARSEMDTRAAYLIASADTLSLALPKAIEEYEEYSNITDTIPLPYDNPMKMMTFEDFSAYIKVFEHIIRDAGLADTIMAAEEDPETGDNGHSVPIGNHGDDADDDDDSDYEDQEENAWKTIVDEAKRQHSLSVGTINSVMMRVGIILAFVPLLLIEAVKQASEKFISIDCVSVSSLSVSLLIGIFVLIRWELSMPSSGTDIDKLLELYENEDWVDLQNYVLNSAITDYDEVENNVYELKKMVFLMAIFLLLGIASLVCTILIR